jgi:hypothetical protein
VVLVAVVLDVFVVLLFVELVREVLELSDVLLLVSVEVDRELVAEVLERVVVLLTVLVVLDVLEILDVSVVLVTVMLEVTVEVFGGGIVVMVA